MSGLKRSELREHIFKAVFMGSFNEDRLPEDVVADYLSISPDEDVQSVDNDRDRSYIRKKTVKILSCKDDLDKMIDRKANGWSITRIGKDELAILRLAVFEMLFDDSVPANVAIDEAVELSHRYGDEEGAPFINGILSTIKEEHKLD